MERCTKKITWIENTPLGISVYSAKSLSTQIQEDLLEIIMCLRGSIKFSYAYEEFTLHAGEFISVDRDAYYLDDGEDNLCVSFYIKLSAFHEKYPTTKNSMFICEAFDGTESNYPTQMHFELQSMLLGLLIYLNENIKIDSDIINKATEKIVNIMVHNFDILFYLAPKEYLSEKYIKQYNEITSFLWEHLYESVSLNDLSERFRLSKSYISEFIRKSGLSFKKMMAYNRANDSEKLLLLTNKSCAEIAEHCGFSDVKLYYRAFERWYKCTPNQFRKKYKFGVDDNLEYVALNDIKEDLMEISTQNHIKKLLL